MYKINHGLRNEHDLNARAVIKNAVLMGHLFPSLISLMVSVDVKHHVYFMGHLFRREKLQKATVKQ